MEGIRKRRLAIILFTLVVLVFFAGFIYALIFSSKDESDWKRFQQRVAESKSSTPNKKHLSDTGPIILLLNEVVSVGKIRLIYRGQANRKLNIAVIIPELDPKTAYLHSIELSKADKGLRLGGEPFSVVSCSDDRLKLRRVAKVRKARP